MLDHFYRGNDIKRPDSLQRLSGKRVDAEFRMFLDNPPFFETYDLAQSLALAIAHQPTVTASVIQPASFRRYLDQRLDGAQNTSPFVLPDGFRGVIKFKNIVDIRVRPAPRIIRFVVDIRVIGIGICHKSEMADRAVHQVKRSLTEAPFDIANG